MKYIKKPIAIDAIKWTGHNVDEIINFMKENNPVFDGNNNIIIRTLEGEMKASPGSWVIRGPKGEYYPCRGDIFEETYEEYEEPEFNYTLECPFCELRTKITERPQPFYDAIHNKYKYRLVCAHCGKKIDLDTLDN